MTKFAGPAEFEDEMLAIGLDRHRDLVRGMVECWHSGSNMIEWAKSSFLTDQELSNPMTHDLVIRLAYDMQAGSYVAWARGNAQLNTDWCGQIAAILEPLAPSNSFSLLEVGVGEATTLSGVLGQMSNGPAKAFGVDLSFARLEVARRYLRDKGQEASLAVANLFQLPFKSDSIDLVYSSHSLEPNYGREREAIRELLRVAKQHVVLVEPDFEGANETARRRMRKNGYVRNLAKAAELAGATISDQMNLPIMRNPLNPVKAWVLQKSNPSRPDSNTHENVDLAFVSPTTGEELTNPSGALASTKSGIGYPIVNGIPLLAAEHLLVQPGV